ncbi:hypothetical protein BGX38DRAFT_1335225 [Terfezia claveryi]|nr:hypothetical protein BGX38DRAFT_1335225 [Terfezia claveryi]
MDPNAGPDGSRHHSSSGSSSSHRQSSSHSSSHSGSKHKSREERPLGSENSYDSSGRLTNMSHATSAASDRHKHSTGPPGSGQGQYEWIMAQQGMSRENYSPIESLRSGYGSSSLSHHSSVIEGSRSGSHSRSGSTPFIFWVILLSQTELLTLKLPPGSKHKSREERPLGSENSYDSSGRLTNMSHATSAASDRHKHSTGPPGSGEGQYEWIKAQQEMSRENYSPIESLRSGYGSSNLSYHSSVEDSRSGSHSRSGSVTAPYSPSSEPSPSGSYHSGSNRSGSNKSTPGSHGNGPHHNSRSHHDSSGSPHSEVYHSDSRKSSRHNSSHHDGTSSPLTHEPSGSGSGGTHDPREREQRDKSRRNKYPQTIGNNPNQSPVSPFITRLSHKICYSMGKPRPTEEEKHHSFFGHGVGRTGKWLFHEAHSVGDTFADG